MGQASVKGLENHHESIGIGQKNLPQLQGHPPRPRSPCHLHGPAPQAAPGLMGSALLMLLKTDK
jgi:hypothetical protein